MEEVRGSDPIPAAMAAARASAVVRVRERRLGLPTTAVTAKLSVTVDSLRWGACEGAARRRACGRNRDGNRERGMR
nr:hypothetical protein GCM10025732_38720 [Glycomyces mayteni]